jgi:carbon-monoxide dehydrogenase medium subunit
MIANDFDYTPATTIEEALELLANGARPLAGGMSLIPLMKLRLASPEHVVDLSRITALNGIREEAGTLRIGATTTHFQVESSALVRRRCPLLAETAGHIGDIQVRNLGTIGGSVAHADPAADYPAALFALEARIRLVSATGERTVNLEDFFIDTLTTSVNPGELVREVIVAADDSTVGASYQKMVQPASGFAIVGVAARIRKSGGKIAMARIGVTGLSGKGFRATNVEALLEGASASEQDVRAAAARIADGVEANSDLHASAEYRKQMARVYAPRAIQAALARAA